MPSHFASQMYDEATPILIAVFDEKQNTNKNYNFKFGTKHDLKL